MAKIAELSAEITAETGDFERGLSNVEKAIAGTRTTIGGLDRDFKAFGRNMGSTNDALRGMGIALPITPMGALGSAVGFVAGQMKAAVDGAAEYAAQVRDLGRSIGATAEETSMLIQAADDVKVSYGSLTAGLQAAIRHGVEPSIEGIGKLADEYNAIQSPIARTKFLMDNFGRAGADLAPLMEKGADGIRELGEAARETGLVLSQEAVDAAREYEIAVDDLTDAWKGFTVQVGNVSIPVLTRLLNETEANYGASKVLGPAVWAEMEAHKAAAEAIDDQARASGALNDTRGEAIRGLEDLNSEAKRGASVQGELASKLNLTGKAMAGTGREAGGFTDNLRRVEDATRDAANASDMLAAGLAGNLQAAQEDYQKVMAETTPEIARLTDEIAKYQRQQGTSVTVTGEATTSVYEYELGALKAAEAQKKLAEFTGDDALELAQLRVNAEHAAAGVVKLGEGMGWSETVTLNYTKKIAELNGTVAEIEAAQAAAEAALRRTTAEIVLQQIAADLGVGASLEFARATGLLSEADYALARGLQNATAAADLDRSGTIDSAAERQKLLDISLKLTDETVALADGTYTATGNMSNLDAALPPVALGLDDVTNSAGLAREGIDRIPDSVEVDTTPAQTSLNAVETDADKVTAGIDLIPHSVAVDTKSAQSSLSAAELAADAVRRSLLAIPTSIHVSVITDNYQNYHGYQIPGTGGPGAAMGADFIVPPGYPHDSYPMRVQSGERVQVTPAGETPKDGGDTYNFNFQNAQPVTIPVAYQIARAVAGSW